MLDIIIGYTLAAALPGALAWIAILYLQRTVKRGVVAGVALVSAALGGLGMLLLLVSLVVPNGLPSPLAYLLLAVPVVVAGLVALGRLVIPKKEK